MNIKVLRDIRSDLPFLDAGVVKAGVHEAHLNPLGAVSCISDKGKKIGIKLDEFEFLSEEDRTEWMAIACPKIPKVGRA